jgi:branched-chain amino acid aminotransferase
MIDNIGRYYLINENLEHADGLCGIDLMDKKVIYEVIRVIKGVPLFLEDHYYRLERSLQAIGKRPSMDFEHLKDKIFRLVRANEKTSCNIKLIVFSEGERQNYLLYISKSYYPTHDEVTQGVRVSIMEWVRDNPNVKLVNNRYKDEVAKRLNEENVFEVLLVNHYGKVTEGSKSNAFFIKGSRVYTAPGDYVLKGITRQYIIEACSRVGVEVEETLLAVDELGEFDGLFISGTSIKVLPVSHIDNKKFDSGMNPVIVSIRDEFDRMIGEYISKNKV